MQDKKEVQGEEQGLIKSTLQETIQAVEQRMKRIKALHVSLESELINSKDTIKSISDIIPGLGFYDFSESPVQPVLRDLYTSQYPNVHCRCVLPPPSEGEESVNEHESREPAFKWLSRAILDTSLLTFDQMEVKKAERGKLPADWAGVTELLVHNISKKINLKQDVKSVEKYLQNCLYKAFALKIAKMQELYYKGKPSILLRFSDQESCHLAYFHLTQHDAARKEHLGDESDVFRVASNRIKSVQQQNWVAVMFRKLPANLTKDTLLDMLRKRSVPPIWMEELVQIDNYKYTLCRVSYLDDAFELCSRFQINSPFKEVKVNLHPKSTKTWKGSQQEFLT